MWLLLSGERRDPIPTLLENLNSVIERISAVQLRYEKALSMTALKRVAM